MTKVTEAEVIENMKENYRIIKCDPAVKKTLSKLSNEAIKLLLEQFFYLGYVYGAEWVLDKTEPDYAKDLRDLINKIRSG